MAVAAEIGIKASRRHGCGLTCLWLPCCVLDSGLVYVGRLASEGRLLGNRVAAWSCEAGRDRGCLDRGNLKPGWRRKFKSARGERESNVELVA